MPKISYNKNYSILIALFVLWAGISKAQNPLVKDQFTADPSAMVVGDRVYVYPSHDVYWEENNGRENWFCMQDYHVFSSENLTDWTDHGVILRQENVPWGNPTANSMWAPDCIESNGKYYFYFPDHSNASSVNGEGFTIGVAVADHPEGPFVPQEEPIKGVKGIDPNVFIDDDGQAYLYWSQGHIYGAKLKENMLELAAEPVILQELPSKGLKEGPYMFKRNGNYYLTYPHVENETERLEYAIGENPLGPFEFKGVIMDESPTGCWTNHHSIINFKGQHYLFYHHNDYSPDFDKNRSIRADSLFFEADGSIRKVVPSLRGIGLSSAFEKVHLDRYSELSETGATIAFLEESNPFLGWKTILGNQEGWVKFDAVDFGKGDARSMTWRVRAPQGGKVQIRQVSKEGQLISEVELVKNEEWQSITVPLAYRPLGIQDLVLQGSEAVEVDWVRWEKAKEGLGSL
ncbi:family 43 glycosylhydrolase [Echinicola marina]|uniref:family 43 glycosylhydrolase n=1 Tax=Echinicola marina TaxID=2859768 RepID=UPI001CF673E6|nr:family 43 glycosylhydrolase [Echinicola marina]UCS93342.1 family 43 glycosylhydrolase [Echinicola marina]